VPIGKKIYDVISKKFKAKKEQVEKVATRDGAIEPPTVHQYTKNKVTRASSKNVHIVDLAGPRNISPNEGMPAVNGKSGPEIVKKAVTKVRPKTPNLDPSAGAIEKTGTQRKCSSCKKPGHTKRNCPRTN
jgi:hypothetical protein